MAPRKLSDSDKNEIIDLYRQPGQTTSTLAEQYGVSNSTVSRILKMSIPSDEYSALISEKRMSGSDKTSTPRRTRQKSTSKTTAKKAAAEPASEVPSTEPLAANQPDDDDTPVKASAKPKLKASEKKKRKQADSPVEAEAAESATPRRRRRRSRSKDSETGQLPLLSTEAVAEAVADDGLDSVDVIPAELLTAGRPKPVLASRGDDELDEDDLVGLDETLGDDFGDDDLDVVEDDDDDDDGDIEMPKPRLSSEVMLSIMPLDEAVLPKPCYLVVDMRAELITRPLVEFSDLGTIPSSEEREKTLPVFENHRVARRFSRNKQRVIKVPDGSLITRTSPYLMAKGITRLLVDGQVFDLVGMT